MRNKFLKALLFGAALVGVMVMTSRAALAADGLTVNYSGQRVITVTAPMPKGIHFAAENDRDLSNEILRLEGGETRMLKVRTNDADGDGSIDQGDFDMWAHSESRTVSTDIFIAELNSTDTAPTYDQLDILFPGMGYKAEVDAGLDAAAAILQRQLASTYGYFFRLTTGGTTSAINASDTDMGYSVDWGAYPEHLATVRVTGVQQAGTESTAFNPEHATVSYRIAYATAQPDDNVLWPTAFINVQVRARDMGSDDGDGGGGSCGVGLGGASLLFACLALLRKRR